MHLAYSIASSDAFDERFSAASTATSGDSSNTARRRRKHASRALSIASPSRRCRATKKAPVVADRGPGIEDAIDQGLRPASITAHIEVIWKSVLVE
jgi:hypothetical protein